MDDLAPLSSMLDGSDFEDSDESAPPHCNRTKSVDDLRETGEIQKLQNQVKQLEVKLSTSQDAQMCWKNQAQYQKKTLDEKIGELVRSAALMKVYYEFGHETGVIGTDQLMAIGQTMQSEWDDEDNSTLLRKIGADEQGRGIA